MFSIEKKVKKIVVLGSLNYDVFLKIDGLPKRGETISADDQVLKAFGGKGANQAVAAARVIQSKNQTVQMLGQVGNDTEGKLYISYL
jgi:ribokinase